MKNRQGFAIGGREIGDGHRTYVIAEIGINHGGDFETAKQLIRAAKDSGADAAKFQTYLTEKRVPKESPIFGILKQCQLSFEQQRQLAAYGAELGICFFSTPFDEESVQFLDELGVPVFKIASFDIVNFRLLRAAVSRGRPMIISTGMADEKEVDKAMECVQSAGVSAALLHCISSYPTPEADANLKAIWALKKRYSCPVGYSDHTLGIEVAVLAVAAGAQIIEKHFTLDKEKKGPDHALSCDPADMKAMVQDIRRVEEILGTEEIVLHEVEKPILQYRRASA